MIINILYMILGLLCGFVLGIVFTIWVDYMTKRRE